MKPKPTFFATPSEWRKWLEENHGTAQEFWVGLHKRASGKPSIDWPQAVDEALCFGWIDGVRKSVDDSSYTIRFTPRRPSSNWSAINVKRAKELTRLGRMTPAGAKAFAECAQKRSGVYSYEQRNTTKLNAAHERQFRANKKAWDFFQAQSPWYRRTTIWWVVNAKKEETKLRRLAQLIRDSAQGRTIGLLTRPAKPA